VNGLLGHASGRYITDPTGIKARQSCRTRQIELKRREIMKLPGPDHPITITQNPRRVRVTAGDVVIADTTKALTLKEARYPAVQYVPREDTNMGLLVRSDRVTHCPYKGDASYYSIKAGGKTLDNAIWTYETPFPAMAEISGCLAFYPDKVKIEEVG
jgi:uncharacterized protein (DUF427 family)